MQVQVHLVHLVVVVYHKMVLMVQAVQAAHRVVQEKVVVVVQAAQVVHPVKVGHLV
jgi:hypothetical protein